LRQVVGSKTAAVTSHYLDSHVTGGVIHDVSQWIFSDPVDEGVANRRSGPLPISGFTENLDCFERPRADKLVSVFGSSDLRPRGHDDN
jgi:hypothetical protein